MNVLFSLRDLTNDQLVEIFKALESVTLSIHQSPTLETALEVGVSKVRELFHSDRALVYKFLPEGDGVILAESVASNTPSILGRLIYDPCFERNWIEPYRQGRTSAIEDVASSSLAPCHIKMLTQMQVTANLVAPIALPDVQPHANRLWGLFILHDCYQPRTWQPLHHQILKQLGTQLGIALTRFQTQQQLEETQQRETRWQTALAAAEDGVWDWNAETNEVFFSREWKKMLGYAEDEIGNSLAEWESRVHPDDLDQTRTALQNHFAGHTPIYRSEHRVQAKDGSWRWILDRGKIVERKPNGSPLRVVGTHVDITAQKQAEQEICQRDEMLRKISEQVPGVVYQYRMDRDGNSCFPYASEAIRYVYEVTPEQVKNDAQPVLDRLHPDDRDRVIEAILDSIESMELWHDQYRVCLPQRGLRWLEGHATPERLADDSVLWHGYIWDITERKQMEFLIEREVQQERTVASIDREISESLNLDTILQTTVTEVRQFLSTDRVLIYRFQPNWRGIVVAESVAPGWREMINQEIADSYFIETQGGSYHDKHINIVDDIYSVGFSECYIDLLESMQVRAKLVVPIVRGDDLWGLLIAHHCQNPRSWQRSESRLLQQLVNHLAIAIQNAELHQYLQSANQELAHLSYTDALTQVDNRRCFDRSLARALLQSQKAQQPLTLILCDIDHFKQYNDTYGHPAGDQCLTAVAQTLQRCLKRSTDSLARYGGEEFAIILPNTDTSGAITVVQEMQQAIARLKLKHESHPSSPLVTLSFGIAAIVPPHWMKPQMFLDRVDQALYAAKAKGRNCYVHLDSTC